MRPSQEVYVYGYPVVINSLGLRGPELQEPKASDTKRVVFVGDSVTYGGGRIREEQLFCRIVETRARDDGFKLEAVNLSAPAWSPQNWWAYVLKRGLLEADIVVLVLPECDLGRVFADMGKAGHLERAPLLRLQYLALLLQTRFGHEQLSARQRPEEVIAANLHAVIGLTQRCRGIPFLAVLIPSAAPQPSYEKLWPTFIPHLPRALDLRQELRDPTFFLDAFHMNVKGHQYVGERIYSRLRQLLK